MIRDQLCDQIIIMPFVPAVRQLSLKTTERASLNLRGDSLMKPKINFDIPQILEKGQFLHKFSRAKSLTNSVGIQIDQSTPVDS